jgi:hypothetical protein
MSDEQATPFGKRVEILADLWLGYRYDEEFEDFVRYNDLGLPMAFILDNKMVKETDVAIAIINETWDLFLASLEVEDGNFDNLEDLLGLDE